MQMDNWQRLALLDELLCVRTPEPELPPDIAESIDLILQHRLARRLATPSWSITERFSRPNASTATAPQCTSPSKRLGTELSIWKGDITTLAHVTAIVNAANSQLLGCFRPQHPCIDNAIHAAAGPGLRRACWELMTEQGAEEPVGQAKVTPGFELHAKCVLHTVGPQLRRGTEPSEEDRRLLASCYTSCLEAAEALEPLPDGRKVLVFCCVSTGMFGFPAEEGCRIAADAVLGWLETHPETTLTDIIFNVFTEEDLAIYRNRFSHLVKRGALVPGTQLPTATGPIIQSPSLSTLSPLLSQQAALVAQARGWLEKSSRLIISAGAGLSAAAGLDYTSKALFTEHHGGFKKYGLHSLYSVFGFSGWPTETARWSYNMHHMGMVRDWPRSRLYDDLFAFTQRRFGGNGEESKWFVRTSNADGFFAKHGFYTSRIATPQGQYAFVQCEDRCREDAVWPSAPFVDDALRHIDPVTQHLPDNYPVPTCSFCGAALTLCVRGGSYFIEEPFEAQNARYSGFVKECLEADTLEETGERNGPKEDDIPTTTILEIGVGMNTPSVLRWHNERLVQRAKERFRLIRIGIGAAGCADPTLEDTGSAIGLYGDVAELFNALDIR